MLYFHCTATAEGSLEPGCMAPKAIDVVHASPYPRVLGKMRFMVCHLPILPLRPRLPA